MKKLITIALFPMVMSGCVKLELNPGNIISDTIEASKDLYKTVKRNKNGEEERIYSHSIPSSGESVDTQKILQCHTQIKSQISVSLFAITEVISESSKVESNNGERTVQCSLSAIVKPVK